jgi:chemosensory pili system protein ChpA (sensor histidine kinase/response regulator)
VSTDVASDFDLGPLSWVQGEIDQALARGLDALATFKANPGDTGALKHARAHIHQAAGAIQMVGLDAVVAFTDEIERHLARLEETPAANVAPTVAALDQACRKLRIFLDELTNGAPPVPLKLYPEFEVMQQLRGLKASAPTDLFYPDLSPRAPRIAPREIIPPNKFPSYLIKQRRIYQRGLLGWLRGDGAGSTTMRDAVAGIEDATTQSNLRSFWWTVGALLESLVEHGVESSFGVKQLAARIDLQIRRVAEGGAKVADRLRREVLYYVAISAPVAPQVQAVQRAFKLSGLIPSAEVLSADVVRLQPLLREAREQLAGAKDSWLKAASGRAENLPKLKQTLASVHMKAAEIKNGAVMKLTAALVERLDRMPASGVSEPMAMEFATALLLAESAFENYTTLSPEFPKQVDAMLARLDAARAGRTPAAGAPALDEMSKRAQERVLLAQVSREIQANLRHMEQVLDAFFRDNSKRGELALLARDSQQIRGALRILGLEEAERLLALCHEQIERYADPETPVSNDDLEMLAESLSGLGFYIEAVEQQRPDRERLITPLIAKRLGETLKPVAVESDSVEKAVEELRAALPSLVAEVRAAPADAAAREDLKRKLAGLRDDAELIGDSDLVTQADAALKDLEAGGTAALAATVEMIADTGAAPAPQISEETQRLLASDQGLDAELLEIYLIEAADVLDAVDEGLTALKKNPGDRDALTIVRRQFHTLKGSGKMVGLVRLGELASDVEKIHNRLLEEDRPVTPTVLHMIEIAGESFRSWVDELTRTRRVEADTGPLHAAIAAVEAEISGGSASVEQQVPPESLPPLVSVPLFNEPVAPTLVSVPPPSENSEAAPASSAQFAATPELELIELPELGMGASDAPEVATEEPEGDTLEIDVPAPHEPFKPMLRVVADNTVTAHATLDDTASQAAASEEIVIEESSPAAEVPQVDEPSAVNETLEIPPIEPPSIEPSIEPPTIEAATSEPEEITIGNATLSSSLWRILCDEAEQHLATLNHELAVLQFDTRVAPSEAMVRASHTLCGIHRTGGFPLIAATAKSLEHTLLALQQRGAPIPTSAQPVLARAIAGLGEFVERVRAKFGFLSAHEQEGSEIQRELEALRQDASGEHAPADAESAAAAAANLEEGTVVEPHPEASVVHATAEVRAPLHVAPPPSPQAEPVVPPTTVVYDTASEAAVATLHDEIDESVLAIFLEEAAELYPQAGEQVRAWRRNPADGAVVQQLRRTLHTFKGSARMAGAMRLGELTHLMESRLLDDETATLPSPALFEALDTDLDRIGYVLDALREGKSNVALPWLADEVPAVQPSAPVAEIPAAPPLVEVMPATAKPSKPVVPPSSERPIVVPLVSPTTPPLPPSIPAAPIVPTTAAATPTSPPAPSALAPLPPVPPLRVAPEPTEVESGARAMLRVRADIVDRLVNEAGEVAIARARVEGELRSLKSNLLELTGSVIRLRGQVREIELQAETQIQSRMSLLQTTQEDFDPLELDRYTRFQELTRSLAEGVNDVSTVQQALLKNLDDADAALLAQARLSRDVQQRLFAIRTVPFGSLSERLYRILRATARELDKRANLEINGGQTELDRSVLEKLVGPLEHLLRNALDHGLEPVDARVAAGKEETGEIALTVRQVGNEVLIEIADDGAGIDFDKVRERAVAQGLIAADANPTHPQLVECLFQPGFSTASKVTQISGRGIGMDVVRSEIAALGGRVEVQTERGKGTHFNLYLPLTLAVAQAVLVRAGGRLWALPAPMVEQVQQVKADALLNLYVRRLVEWQGREYPFHYLPRLLGDTGHNPETARYNPVLLLRSGQNHAAIHVDEMIGNQEVVVKNIGPQLARVSGISGATVLGTGEIVLIINPVQLAQRVDVPSFDPSSERVVSERPTQARAVARERSLVMIVDDSLTVRKITSRLLTREGFEVVTAKDGIDALQVLTEQTPDLILLDIEMPRMDGFEFTKTIKGDPRNAHIPIIMVTSRTAEKHRNRAAELGVDLYLGKPYQEEDLLKNLRDILSAHEAA